MISYMTQRKTLTNLQNQKQNNNVNATRRIILPIKSKMATIENNLFKLNINLLQIN